MRTVGEIRDDIRGERTQLADAAVALRREIDRSLDVRTRLRRHPMAEVGIVLAVVLLVAFLVSVPIVAATVVGRALRGLWERIR